MYLEKINGPADVKALNSPERTALAAEMRTALIQKLSHHGGHCGPNLGLVEATIALHTVFDSPKDRFVFDVSHQTYPHKMLTGRSYGFLDPARYDEITGDSAPQESAHDPFTLGHTSTSVSLACGLAKARDAKGEHHNVVAIIGDGSLSGGEALEGLDLAGDEFRNTQDGNNNAYCQDNDITWLKWDWMYSTNKTREMRRLETVSRLVALRKSLDLYHHEDFFTRLTQIGLLKPSSRVQWFLPDGTTPMERDWFALGVRSFTMRLLSNSEVDVCIVVNGTAVDRTFRLPPDTHWTPKWCSAEINGRRAGHGTQVEECDLNGDTTVWTQHVPDASETVLKMVEEAAMQRTESSTENEADTIKFAMPVTDHAADGTSSAPRDEVSADMPDAPVDDTPATPVDDNVWTMPALSITLMKQV